MPVLVFLALGTLRFFKQLEFVALRGLSPNVAGVMPGQKLKAEKLDHGT